MTDSPVTLAVPLEPDRVTYFRSEIERARRLRDERLLEWDTKGNLERYSPPKKNAVGINTGVDFSDVETKKAGLFYDTPAVHVKPDPEGDPTATLLHQEILNTVLKEIHAKATVLKCVQDCLLAIQPAPSKIGYIPTSVNVDRPRMTQQVDPQTGQTVSVPVLDPLTQQPMIDKDVPVIIYEQWFWSRLSPKAVLLPVDFRDTDYDASPWLGYDWRKPVSEVRRWLGLPEDWSLPAGGGTLQVSFTDETQRPELSSDPPVTGTYLEYRAYLIDPTIQHPEMRRCLVLIDGVAEPMKHENVGWQTFDNDGRLSPDSLSGYSIHPLSLRDLTDSAWVAADSSITAGLTHELNDARTKNSRQRAGSPLAFVYDSDRFPPEVVTQIQSGTMPATWAVIDGMLFIPAPSGAISGGVNNAMMQLPVLQQGRESFVAQDIIKGDRDRVLGISANRAGAQDAKKQTATESQNTQRNTDARFEQERQRVLDWWISGVSKLSALLLRFGDRKAIEVLGQQRGQMWLQARQAGKLGRCTFEIKIDSGKYIDVEMDRRQTLQFYNMTGKDPNARRVVVLKELAHKFGYDPQQLVVEQLPEPKPEPAKASFAFTPADFNPALPSFPIAVEIARKLGMEISDEAIAMAKQQAADVAASGRSQAGEPANEPMEAMVGISSPLPTATAPPDPKKLAQQKQLQAKQQQPHGGGMPKGEPISQHQFDETGRRDGPQVPM